MTVEEAMEIAGQPWCGLLGDAAKVLVCEVERLRESIERLGSMEGFVFSRMIRSPQDDELMARINYARSVLQVEEGR